MEALILFIIIMVISSTLKGRGRKERRQAVPRRKTPEPAFLEEEFDIFTQKAGQQISTIERRKGKFLYEQKIESKHGQLPRERKKNIREGIKEETRHQDSLPAEKQKGPSVSSAASLFAGAYSLHRAVILAEILGPPRAKKPWGK